MPAGFQIDAERGLIVSQASGVVTEDDLREHQTKLRQDPDFDPGYDQLWDFRDVTEISVSSEAIRDLARARSFDPGARRALVAVSDVGFGVARMFAALHDDAPEEVQVFRSVEEARDWLGTAP